MITLIGHGYIGKHIHEELNNQSLKHHWINHSDEVPSDTSVIINSAGFTGVPNVDACELTKQKTIEGNVLFPLALERANKNTPIVHISSGCVYVGDKEGGYTEEDPINFNFDNGSFYSGTKGLSQMILEPFMNKSYILRVRMPFGSTQNPKNLLTKLSSMPKLVDFANSLSCVEDVAKVAVYFAINKPEFGIYNVCNPGYKTTKQIADMLGLDKEWFTVEEFEKVIKAPRSNCVLNTDKLSKVYPMPTVDEALTKAIANLK